MQKMYLLDTLLDVSIAQDVGRVDPATERLRTCDAINVRETTDLREFPTSLDARDMPCPARDLSLRCLS